MNEKTRLWLEADRAHCWHPFTDQGAWGAGEPLVLVKGEGVWLEDSEGRRYLDGNSSIWTNIHGHNHPVLNAAVEAQLGEVAHTSFLGYANPRASELAERLVGQFPEGSLERVFFSDDGSTAVEVAVKMAIQYRQQTGEEERTGFLAFADGYHGDTMGAASLGGVKRFFDRFRQFGFPVRHVESVEVLRSLSEEEIAKTAAVVIEPLVQGVNEMRVWPEGMLRELRDWCDATGVQLICDEVMTGFGRTGTMFACQQEEVVPDYLCLAKGLTGGYLPLAATLTTGKIYEAFLGGPEKVFYYGHSYTANQLGAAVSLASLDLLEAEGFLEGVRERAGEMAGLLRELKGACPNVHEVRQRGLIAGVDLREEDGSYFAERGKAGAEVCAKAREFGLLTRPIQDTVVLMPPLVATGEEIGEMVERLERAISGTVERAAAQGR
jgi:adenosylmethionine-8-amino-7-oxononanoate aminotransferase